VLLTLGFLLQSVGIAQSINGSSPLLSFAVQQRQFPDSSPFIFALTGRPTWRYRCAH
jgi:hypothetical protein